MTAKRPAHASEVIYNCFQAGSWCSGTPHNRWTFFCEARRVLEALGQSTALTILDTHSMLQLLCPDLPLGIVKNAFTPASMLQGMLLIWQGLLQSNQTSRRAELELWCAAEEEDNEEVRKSVDPEPSFVASGAGKHTSSSRTVTVALFLACLRVTFIFEHHLMELRRACFDKSKRCALSPGPVRCPLGLCYTSQRQSLWLSICMSHPDSHVHAACRQGHRSAEEDVRAVCCYHLAAMSARTSERRPLGRDTRSACIAEQQRQLL